MNINARLQIGRATSNVNDDYIRISIADETSGVTFVELEVPLAQFAEAITSLSVGDIPAKVRGLDLIGKRHENKTVLVEIEPGTHMHGDAYMAAVAEAVAEQHEVDGWKASEYELRQWNGHRFTREGDREFYSVILHRYVDVE